MRSALRYTLFFFCLFIVYSCSNSTDGIDDVLDESIVLSDSLKKENVNNIVISSFSFLKENNPLLSSDIYISQSEFLQSDTISIDIPDVCIIDSLIPSFSGNFEKVCVGGVEQISGITPQNYSTIIRYDFYGKGDIVKSCFFKVLFESLIPRVDIITEAYRDIVSKDEYVNAAISITNTPLSGPIFNKGKIKLRGNATIGMSKRPYKIKFSKKESPFGFPANKDWVLLAMAMDGSLMRTCYMCEVSKALGIKYTINYQHVELFLNGNYQGTYLLTDQIEKAKNRVNVENDGFFIEGDNYYQYEPLFFVTDSFKIGMTFKYPNPNKGEILINDDNFRFIQSYMNKVEKSLLDIPKGIFDYMDLIEPHSFAKFIIAEEVLANFDSNFYYVLSSRKSKLEMYPLWDFDWSLGLGEINEKGWVKQPNKPRIDVVYWKDYPYVKYLYYDPLFIIILQEEWISLKNQIPAIHNKLSYIRKTLEYASVNNREKWRFLDVFRTEEQLVFFEDWSQEVDYIEDFFDKRVLWFDNYVMNELQTKYNYN